MSNETGANLATEPIGVSAGELLEGLEPNGGPSSIVSGPQPPASGELYGKTDSEVERVATLKKEREAARLADPALEELRKLGTDEQEVPFAPETVVVSRGALEGVESATKCLSVYLIPGGHPVLAFDSVEGQWSGRDVLHAWGAIRKGFRQYQVTLQRRKSDGEG